MAPLLDRVFARRSWIVGGLLLLALTACRVPKLPVIEDKSIGMIYDTAMEEKLRSGKAHALEV